MQAQEQNSEKGIGNGYIWGERKHKTDRKRMKRTGGTLSSRNAIYRSYRRTMDYKSNAYDKKKKTAQGKN